VRPDSRAAARVGAGRGHCGDERRRYTSPEAPICSGLRALYKFG